MSDEEKLKLTRFLLEGVIWRKRYYALDVVDGKNALCEELKGKIIEKVVYSGQEISGTPTQIEIHFKDDYTLVIDPLSMGDKQKLQLILK